MSESRRITATEAIAEFDGHLDELIRQPHRTYTFEIPDSNGRLRECGLDEVIQSFRDYIHHKNEAFRVIVCYSDYASLEMGKIDKTFTRVARPTK